MCAVRNVLLGGTDMGAEEATSDDWNDTFNTVSYRLLKTDATSATTNATTELTAVIHAFSSGDIFRFIDINVDSEHYLLADDDADPNGTKTGIINIYIGESGSEVLKDTFRSSLENGDNVLNQVRRSHRMIYEPTTAEKTNGFNVIVKYKAADVSGLSSGYAKYHSSFIMGA